MSKQHRNITNVTNPQPLQGSFQTFRKCLHFEATFRCHLARTIPESWYWPRLRSRFEIWLGTTLTMCFTVRHSVCCSVFSTCVAVCSLRVWQGHYRPTFTDLLQCELQRKLQCAVVCVAVFCTCVTWPLPPCFHTFVAVWVAMWVAACRSVCCSVFSMRVTGLLPPLLWHVFEHKNIRLCRILTLCVCVYVYVCVYVWLSATETRCVSVKSEVIMSSVSYPCVCVCEREREYVCVCMCVCVCVCMFAWCVFLCVC